MGFKAIEQHYDIKYIVAIYNKEGLGPCVCIGSGYVHDLVAISIKDCKIKYSCIVKPGEDSEIGQLAARIAKNTAGRTQRTTAQLCTKMHISERGKKPMPTCFGIRRRGLCVATSGITSKKEQHTLAGLLS